MVMNSGHSFEGTLDGKRLAFDNGISIKILPDSKIFTNGNDITEIVANLPDCINTPQLTCIYIMTKLI